MFDAWRKSKTVAFIALDRVSDYVELIRIEFKLREQILLRRLISTAIALLFGLLALIFFIFALIVTWWDSPYRLTVTWLIVVLLVAGAMIAVFIGRKHLQSSSPIISIREQLQRDITTIKENL